MHIALLLFTSKHRGMWQLEVAPTFSLNFLALDVSQMRICHVSFAGLYLGGSDEVVFGYRGLRPPAQ